MGRLTKAQIVTRGLEIVGNTSIQTTAELWCDVILESIARTWRYPELAKTHSASIGDGTETVAYPSDYGFLIRDPARRGVGSLKDSSNTISDIYLAGLGEVTHDPAHIGTSKGTPTLIADDHQNSRWQLHPISNVAGTLRLSYQAVPAVVASTETVWFPDDLALIEAIIFMAERRGRGNALTVDAAAKEAAMVAVRRGPSRAQLWTVGKPGGDLCPRYFRK